MEMLFCIKHQRMEKAQPLFDTVRVVHPDGVEDERVVQIGLVHEVHTYPTFDNPSGDLDWCEFDQGWATTYPPVDPQSFEDWIANPPEEPSRAELDAMDAEAENILLELSVL